MNHICVEQNSELQLNRLGAQRALYGWAKTIFATHAFLSTVVAGTLSYLALRVPEMKPYAALWGSLLSIVDVCWLSPWQKKLRETAAIIQESFDCDVLGLPWRPMKVGKAADHETVYEYGTGRRAKEPSVSQLRDWYPSAVCGIPLFLARIVCQRTNAWWDGKQRRFYAAITLGAVVVLLAGLVVLGIVRKMAVPDLLVTTIVPLTSGITFALRQYKENSEAASRLDKLKEHAEALWKRALAGAKQNELESDCRLLQDELFDNRKRNVPVFDTLYTWLRPRQERQMHANAEQLVRDLMVARGGKLA